MLCGDCRAPATSRHPSVTRRARAAEAIYLSVMRDLHLPRAAGRRVSDRVKDPVSGFSHLTGLVVALAAVSFLLGFVYARGNRAMLASCAAYGATLLALYAASSVYHLVLASPRVTRLLRLLDHAAIYLLIAGTCTPVFHRAFEGETRVVMLGVVWGLAASGVLLELVWRSAPRLLTTAIYVAMGWLAVVRWGDVVHALPTLALALVVGGGVLYTLGALVYASKRPDPWPDVFGFHEIWHLFVLGGSATHFAAVAVLATPVG
jgi:hemolysin III